MLEHIASSATFPNRGGTSTSFAHPPQGEILGGSVFRVSVSDHDAMTRGMGHPRPFRNGFITSVHESDGPSTMTSPHDGYSAGIISFPAGPPASSQTGRGRSPDDPDIASDGDLSGSHNGKKHVCPTCSKRFNRPSSLRIHVNTHTGATRKPRSLCFGPFVLIQLTPTLFSLPVSLARLCARVQRELEYASTLSKSHDAGGASTSSR